MLSAKSPSLTADLINAKAYMNFWAKGSTQVLMYKANNGFIPTANDADSSTYDVLTKKAVSIVSAAKKITQFMDRDTRPDFAGANACRASSSASSGIPPRTWLRSRRPIQAFWDALPAYVVAPVPTPAPTAS